MIMSAIRAKGTDPEETLISTLRRSGIRSGRRHLKKLPGRPDLSFLDQRIAVFVNGCYWHRCPYCKKPLPKSHRSFWRKKFEANVERDKRKNRELRKLGWRPIVVWECRLKNDPEKQVARIKKMLDLPLTK
ncbi:MAG TPA: very short patch repair endonuclease [bacterium]|nr:very short patch repair endonuclease [bacterium]